jgi:hypothetical protein
MSSYVEKFVDRRCGKDRRDWDEFVLTERRNSPERRSGVERRKKQLPFIGPERRRLRTEEEYRPSYSTDLYKPYYTLNEAADVTETSASDILEWIRASLLKDSEIKRDFAGRRLFSRRHIEQIQMIKRYGSGNTL